MNTILNKILVNNNENKENNFNIFNGNIVYLNNFSENIEIKISFQKII